MEDRSAWRCSPREAAYLGLLLLLTGALAFDFASPYAVPGLEARAGAGSAFFGVAALAALAYCWRRHGPERWAKSLLAGCLMLATAAAAYSLARHEAVLLPFSALFCLPGAALGGLAGLRMAACHRLASSASATAAEPAPRPIGGPDEAD